MKPAFTLVELLIAITIIGLITAAAVANFRGTNPETQLRLQASNLASVLRQAQVQAQSGQLFAGSLPSGGYGVAVANCAVPPCSVTLFADQNSSFSLQAPAEVIDEVSLGDVVTINSISTTSPAHVMFRPPAGAICFDNVCAGAAPLVITLGARGTSSTKTITVNQLSAQVSY